MSHLLSCISYFPKCYIRFQHRSISNYFIKIPYFRANFQQKYNFSHSNMTNIPTLSNGEHCAPIYQTKSQISEDEICHNFELNITNQEQQLFDLFNSVALYINNEYNIKTVLRVAGGWVRDKLLGLESNDVDLAIDVLSGEQFATYVKEYCEKFSKDTVMHTIATVKVNPDKSKHLEAATTNINGLSIDFVNLRSEEYTHDSRTPTMTFGTAEEDANRRDITINALFYNIGSKQIEDFTRKGVKDLKNGIIRTPLEPSITFMDDPLRILRIIRFSTRFKYEIVSEILESFGAPELKEALRVKVSKERIGIELLKTLNNGEQPSRALNYIYDYGFFPVIFTSNRCISIDDWSLSKQSITLLESLFNNKDNISNLFPSLLDIVDNKEKMCLLYLSTLVIPYTKTEFMNNNQLDNNKIGEMSRFLMLDSLKLNNNYSGLIESLQCNLSTIINFSNEISKSQSCINRGNIGDLVLLVSKKILKDQWHLALVYAAMVKYLRTLNPCDPTNVSDFLEVYKDFNLIAESALSYGLHSAYSIKPLLNGKELSSILGCTPGPQIGRLLSYLIHWQFCNPSASKEEATMVLKTHIEQNEI